VNGSRLLVLCWHSVDTTPAFPTAPGAGITGFERQLRHLSRWANVLPLPDALDALYAGRLPRRAVCITFDDGYRDNLDHAVPLLLRYRMPATFYLVPQFLDHTRTAWWETVAWALRSSARRPSLVFEGAEYRLGPGAPASANRLSQTLKDRNLAARTAAVDEVVAIAEPAGRDPGSDLLLDWDGARKLVQAGFDIGSHSLDHAILANESPATQRANVAEARSQLSDRLDHDVATIAYPNGRSVDADELTRAAARAAGHRYGVLLEPGWVTTRTDPFAVKRPFVLPQRGPAGMYVQLGRRAVRSARTLASRPLPHPATP
jgi:peptidoglycan/xylan/chitin deacetylase (PgdA/CDA1 family)